MYQFIAYLWGNAAPEQTPLPRGSMVRPKLCAKILESVGNSNGPSNVPSPHPWNL